MAGITCLKHFLTNPICPTSQPNPQLCQKINSIRFSSKRLLLNQQSQKLSIFDSNRSRFGFQIPATENDNESIDPEPDLRLSVKKLQQHAEVVEIITQLEAKNQPTQDLALLNGKWILLYTSFTGLLLLQGRVTMPLVKVEEISQIIDSENLTVQNSVVFAGPLATTSLSTNAKFEVTSPKRLQIKFEEGIIGTPQLTDSIEFPESGLITPIQDTASSVIKSISNQPPLKIPITGDNAQSWLLTTYLDEELRVSRGDGGTIFVLIKEGNSLLTP
ncbi:hypothetical protein MKX01_021666 [Papaver californicum]|nr:hypothetical protein MKX01_021666 [Papaver californicum]